MTPEQRAEVIVEKLTEWSYHESYRGPLSLADLIAEAIRQAIQEEREAIAESVRILMKAGTPVDGVVQAIRKRT